MPLLFAYGINRFSHDMAYMVVDEQSEVFKGEHRPFSNKPDGFLCEYLDLIQHGRVKMTSILNVLHQGRTCRNVCVKSSRNLSFS